MQRMTTIREQLGRIVITVHAISNRMRKIFSYWSRTNNSSTGSVVGYGLNDGGNVVVLVCPLAATILLLN